MLAGLSDWLDSYGRGCEARDARAVSELFTEDASYQPGPFARKLRGRVMIREAVAETLEAQERVAFGAEILSAGDRHGIARWWYSAEQPAAQTLVRCEGIFRLAFDESGLCESLEAWFNATEDPL